MERGCEARIKCVQVKRVKHFIRLWVTLWEEFSVLNRDIYRCMNIWVKNLKTKTGHKEVKILKVDFKVDSFGSICASNYQSVNNQMLKALNKACKELTELDNGYFDHQDEWVFNHSNKDMEFKALKGFKNSQTFLSGNIIAQKEVYYNWKRYHKQSELIQKASVGVSFGSRFPSMVGEMYFQNLTDPHFHNRLRRSRMSGMTRDEIGVWRITGLL